MKVLHLHTHLHTHLDIHVSLCGNNSDDGISAHVLLFPSYTTGILSTVKYTWCQRCYGLASMMQIAETAL